MSKISHIDIQLLSFRNSGPVQPYKGKNMAKTMPICPLITKTTKAAKLIPRYAIISECTIKVYKLHKNIQQRRASYKPQGPLTSSTKEQLYIKTVNPHRIHVCFIINLEIFQQAYTIETLKHKQSQVRSCISIFI